MTGVLGGGEYAYVPTPDWPSGVDITALGEVAGVGVDESDDVYLFTRGPHPVVVVNAAGRLLRTWGEGTFVRPHGIDIGPDGLIYCTDDGDHSVRRCSPDGEVLLTIGVPGCPSPAQSGLPFNRCTHSAVGAGGDIYVTDGYGNARVHRYSSDGEYRSSWGGPGMGPGEFNLPHNILCDEEGWVYVADRESHRVQVFDPDGKYKEAWHNLHRPSALGRMKVPRVGFVVGEIGPYLGANFGWPNLGPRLSLLDEKGNLIARIQSDMPAGVGLGRFVSPHGVASDSQGNLYVADVMMTAWPSLFPSEDPPVTELRGVQKLTRTTA
jgi:DNA-binding beta-propeller fold protein YncE